MIELPNDPDGTVARRVRSHVPTEIGLSTIALHELYYGAFRSKRPEHNVGLVDRFLFDVLGVDQEDGRHAEIQAALAKQGSPIGPYDALIAGQARARDLILVTASVDEFRRVDGLSVEDWSEGDP